MAREGSQSQGVSQTPWAKGPLHLLTPGLQLSCCSSEMLPPAPFLRRLTLESRSGKRRKKKTKARKPRETVRLQNRKSTTLRGGAAELAGLSSVLQVRVAPRCRLPHPPREPSRSRSPRALVGLVQACLLALLEQLIFSCISRPRGVEGPPVASGVVQNPD